MSHNKNLVSNSDFNRKRIRSKEHIEGGEEYLKSSYGRFADGSNASVLISSSFASENIVGGGQLRSNNYSASSRSIKGKRAYAHFKGGEGNYTSLMSSDFAGTETMLNPDYIVGGGAKSIWIRLQRKGASRLSVLVAQACSLFMDASRMTSVLIHEMKSLTRFLTPYRREVQAL